MTTKAEQRPPHNPSIRCGSSPCRLPRGRLGLWGQGSSLSPKPQVHFLFSEHPSSEILCQTQLTKGQDLLSQKHLHLKCPRLSWRRRQWPPLQYSCLENPMDGGAWWAAVHGVARSRTRLSGFTLFFHFDALEKEMATHSSVLAWRIPGMGEPGGLPSMGSHRVGHD